MQHCTSVTECADAAATNCLFPTAISYQNGQSGVTSTVATAVSSTISSVVSRYDLNGDGYPDLLFLFQNGTDWYAAFGSPSGYGSPIATGVSTVNGRLLAGDMLGSGADGLLANNAGVWTYYTWNGSAFAGTATNLAFDSSAASFGFADVNGDGLPDLTTLTCASPPSTAPSCGALGPPFGARITIRLNASNGSTPTFSATASAAYQDTASSLWSVALNSSARIGPLRSFDFNGDGREDFVLTVSYKILNQLQYRTFQLLAQGNTFTAVAIATNSISSPQLNFVDWNSDRCTDYILNQIMYLSGCNGTIPAQINIGYTPHTTLDWNGDGRTDLLYSTSTTPRILQIQLSTGSSIGSPIVTSIPYSSSSYFAIDANADGLDDLAVWGSSSINYHLHNGPGQQPDLVTSITDGYGISSAPTYANLPQNRFGPISVASQAVESDGTGGSFTKTFTYTNPRYDLQGRGFSGFQSRREQDSRPNSPVLLTSYSTSFPHTFRVAEENVFQPNGTTLISKTVFTPATTTLDATTANQRYFPYFSTVTKHDYEVGGAKNGLLITTTTQTRGYDSVGNETTRATTVADSDMGSPYYGQQWTTNATSAFTPDTGSNWCVGLPNSNTITNTAPGVSAMTRTQSFVNDYAYCRRIQAVTEPGSPSYAVTGVLGFDGFGNVNSVAVTGAGMTTRATTVNWGTTGQFPMTVTNPLNQSTTRNYNFDLGLMTSETDPNGIVTSMHYDAFGRKDTETRPDGTSTAWVYNDCATWGGCLIGSHSLALVRYRYNADGSVLTDGTTYFDQFDRPLIENKRMLTGGYDRNEVRYDNLGRVQQQAMPCTWSAVTTACPYWTMYTHDILNRRTAETRPINSSNTSPQSTTIFYQGRTVIATDPQGKSATKIFTVAGTLGRSQDHDGYYQNFGYDAFGSLLSINDSLSNALFSASYVYGIDAFQVGTTDMDRGTWGYTPNALGEVTAITDANGASFTMSYDPLSRPLTRSVSGEGATAWTWGTSAALREIGQLNSISVASGPSESFTYDSVGRLSRHRIVADATYDYDYGYNSATGLLGTLTYPTSTSGYRLALQYVYQNGFLSQVKDANAGTAFWTANTANPRGQVTQETLGNGLKTNRTFDPVTGWISSIQCGPGGGTCSQNHSYLFDLVGNLIQRQNNNLGLTENFYYDNLYRLDFSQLNGSANLDLSYNALGNITGRSDVAGGAAWTYDSVRKHQLRQAGTPSLSYTYDSNGNAVTRNGLAITWTKYNLPKVINGNGESTTLSYDANQRRWKQVYVNGSTTETSIYIGDAMEKVTVGSLTDYRHYINANGQAVAILSRTSAGSNTTRYVLRDHQDSIIKITDAAGAKIVSESFTAFGVRRNPATWSGTPTNGEWVASNAITREGYTGQDSLGSLGLNHMNGRVQDAITGRFLSADPFVVELGNTQNFNRYSYVNNNPMTFTDPSGFSAAPPALLRPRDAYAIEEVTVWGSRDLTFSSGLDFLSLNLVTQRVPGPAETIETVTVTARVQSQTTLPQTQSVVFINNSTQPQEKKPPCRNTRSSNVATQFVRDTGQTILGIADAVSFGGYTKMTEAMGLGTVDHDLAYDAGLYGTAAVSGLRMLYAGAASTIQFIPGITAAEAVASRNTVKGVFSTLGADHPRAYTASQMMAKYGSESAVIKAASGSNPALNTAAAALAASSAMQIASPGCQ